MNYCISIWLLSGLLLELGVLIDGATPPQITPSTETITLTVNQDEPSLRCTHSEDIQWIIPTQADAAFYTISPSTRNAANAFETSVTFNYNTTAHPAQTLVGSYYCLSKTLAASGSATPLRLNHWHAQNQTARIFVFVKDAEVKVTSSSEGVQAMLGSTTYFPCWPTEELLTITVENQFSEPIDNAPLPHLGIPFDVTVPNDFGLYTCSHEDGDEATVDLAQIYPMSVQIAAEHLGHAELGGELRLECSANSTSEQDIAFQWTCPGRRDTFAGSTLSLTNLTAADEGAYTCTARDQDVVGQQPVESASQYVKIVEEPFIRFAPNQELSFEFRQGADANFHIWYSGYPVDKLPRWTSPILDRMDKSRYYTNHTLTTAHEARAELTIRNIRIDEAGPYTLDISNTRIVAPERVQFQISVTAVPEVRAPETLFVRPGHGVTVRCNVTAYPPANVSWTIAECDMTFSDCQPIAVAADAYTFTRNGFTDEHVLNYQPKAPGQVTCAASNRVSTTGGVSARSRVYVMEQDEHFVAVAPPDFVAGLNQSLVCFASKYVYESVDWYLAGKPVAAGRTAGVTVSAGASDYMFRSSLAFEPVAQSMDGDYECRARRGATIETLEQRVRVKPYAPVTIESDSSSLVLGSGILWISCVPHGMPRPLSVSWYHNNDRLNASDHITLNETRLQITSPSQDDVGTYKCVAASTTGETVAKEFVFAAEGLSTGWVVVICLLAVVIVILLAAGLWYIWRERSKIQRLKEQFLHGNGQPLNPHICLSNQAGYLPYDSRFDCGANQLVLGHLLGTGAFGEVLLADASGIGGHGRSSKVAVKRVRPPVDQASLEALIGEMKIMIAIGRHRNVLALLGVVHENLHKGELLVITEFCARGNLWDVVTRNRSHFVDQVDRRTDSIDRTVRLPNQSDATTVDEQASNSAGPLISKHRTTDANAVDGAAPSGPVDGLPITTTDLVCWCYQVAQGMHFLACKNVLHGDLAARNVLMTHDGTVKICDFGMSRKLRPETDYMKASLNSLPLKWMAIESLDSGLFNTSTDVWSFGVMAWELFTLGATPYGSDQPDNDRLLARLQSGDRLERPKHATHALHRTLLTCWRPKPDDRPRFSQLAQQLAAWLPDELVRKYEDTSADYVTVVVDRSSVAAAEHTPPESIPMLPTIARFDSDLDLTEDNADQRTNHGNVYANVPRLSDRDYNTKL